MRRFTSCLKFVKLSDGRWHLTVGVKAMTAQKNKCERKIFVSFYNINIRSTLHLRTVYFTTLSHCMGFNLKLCKY